MQELKNSTNETSTLDNESEFIAAFLKDINETQQTIMNTIISGKQTGLASNVLVNLLNQAITTGSQRIINEFSPKIKNNLDIFPVSKHFDVFVGGAMLLIISRPAQSENS